VLGAYFVLCPASCVVTLVFVCPVRIPAWFFLGLWSRYQLLEANFGLFSAGRMAVAWRSAPTSAASSSE
jgi:hypothetical protein